MKKKLFILRDKSQKTILKYEEYDTTSNIDIEILEEYPKLENIEGKIGKYVLDDNGYVTVEYTDIPKTDIELLQEENDALTQRMSELQETLASFIMEGAE